MEGKVSVRSRQVSRCCLVLLRMTRILSTHADRILTHPFHFEQRTVDEVRVTVTLTATQSPWPMNLTALRWQIIRNGVWASVRRFSLVWGTHQPPRGTMVSASSLSHPTASLIFLLKLSLCVRPGFGFPNTDCESGLNHRIHFPACWDGKVRF
jgi:hypothetical protein